MGAESGYCAGFTPPGATKYQYWSSWTGLGGWRDKQNGCIVSATRYYLACCPPPFPLGLSASFSSSIVANCDSPKTSSHHPRLRPPDKYKIDDGVTSRWHGHQRIDEEQRALEIRERKRGLPGRRLCAQRAASSERQALSTRRRTIWDPANLGISERETLLFCESIATSSIPPPRKYTTYFRLLYTIANMLPSALLCVASAVLASAHTIITYPGWRGNNLITNDTFPYGMQWMYPCE